MQPHDAHTEPDGQTVPNAQTPLALGSGKIPAHQVTPSDVLHAAPCGQYRPSAQSTAPAGMQPPAAQALPWAHEVVRERSARSHGPVNPVIGPDSVRSGVTFPEAVRESAATEPPDQLGARYSSRSASTTTSVGQNGPVERVTVRSGATFPDAVR